MFSMFSCCCLSLVVCLSGGKKTHALLIQLICGWVLQEALHYLKLALHEVRLGSGLNRLETVTGAGHHSPWGVGKIKRAVLGLCDRWQLRCDIKNEGCFIIYCGSGTAQKEN